MITFDEMLNRSPYKAFDYITSDCEGFDVIALRQMNLKELETKVICIEHNGDQSALSEIRRLCSWYGLNNQLLINGENIVLTI